MAGRPLVAEAMVAVYPRPIWLLDYRGQCVAIEPPLAARPVGRKQSDKNLVP